MGLDEFKTETEYDIGEVKTRKKIENVKIDNRTWKRLLYFDPQWASSIAGNSDEQTIKAIVQTMDEVIQEGLDTEKISEDQIDTVKSEREKLVDFHLRGE